MIGWLAALFFALWAVRLAYLLRHARAWAAVIARGGSKPSRAVAEKILSGERFQ